MSGSGGLVFRGKTPRSTSQTNAFAMDAVIAHAAEGGEASSHTHTRAHVQSPYGAGPQRGSSFGFGNESEVGVDMVVCVCVCVCMSHGPRSR
jgi:hypothetical protein